MRAKAQVRVRDGQPVGPLEGELAATAPAGMPGEGDRRHHFPVALPGPAISRETTSPLLDARGVARG